MEAASSPLLRIAVFLGWGLGWTTLALVVTIVVMRGVLLVQMAHQRSFVKRWRSRLMRYVLEMDDQLPPLHRRDAVLLFGIWNHLHDTVRGEATARLNQFAERVGLHREARRLLDKRRPRLRLVALLALGNLRDASVWDILRELVSAEDPLLSLAALRAMLLVDPGRAIRIVAPIIGRREDWPPTRVAHFLADAGADVVAPAMVRAAVAAPPSSAARLIKYVAAINAVDVLPEIRRLLASTHSPTLIVACLAILRDAEDLPTVRGYLDHPAWFVRTQAASTLGRIGILGDEMRLAKLLDDREWWVRYRAGQALANLPFVSAEDMRDIQALHQDTFARDILEQVLAERVS